MEATRLLLMALLAGAAAQTTTTALSIIGEAVKSSTAVAGASA